MFRIKTIVIEKIQEDMDKIICMISIWKKLNSNIVIKTRKMLFKVNKVKEIIINNKLKDSILKKI